MDDGYSLISLFIFMGFVLLDSIFYGFGAAIQNVNVSNLEKEMEDGNEKARKLLHIVNRPTRFINTIQITTNLISMITGAFVLGHLRQRTEVVLGGMENLPKPWLSIASLTISGLLLMLILVSFGIVIPKRCAQKNPERWGYRYLSVISFIIWPLLPFTWLVSVLSYVVLRLFGIDMTADNENVTQEDIMSMVNEGHEQGVLEASEAEMITNIFEFDDKEASDIMTHRKNLVALDGEMTLQEAFHFILREGNNSRYPVYEKDIDDVIGVLHMKDAAIYAANKEYENCTLNAIPGILREAHFIPETRNISSLFKEMQSEKIHMEIVVDEYGQTTGIVTMEDILEEIVGNIMDEYDVDEEYIIKSEDGSYLMNGMTPLDEVGDALEVEFEEEYDTLNGFLISKLDRIPQDGEEPEELSHGYLFQILKVENKIIHTVRISKINDTKEDSGIETGREESE